MLYNLFKTCSAIFFEEFIISGGGIVWVYGFSLHHPIDLSVIVGVHFGDVRVISWRTTICIMIRIN
jgi:hypothetical protein